MRLTFLLPCLLAATPAVANASHVAAPEGLWLNPHRSVVVQAAPCGARLCGRIVWANGEALSDARDSGVTRLIGTTLLQDYRADGAGRWRGTVFVPDMGRSFASIIDEVTPGSLRVRGCVFGGFICKSQTWTRIAAVPHD